MKSAITILANALYDAVVNEKPDFIDRAPMIIDRASMLYTSLSANHPMREQLAATMHDYALMLAADLCPRTDCAVKFDANSHLNHPCPFDDIINALEESGWITNDAEEV